MAEEIGVRLIVDVQMEVRYEHRVDIVGYYENMHERERAAYEEAVRAGHNGHEPWEMPVAWLYPQDGDNSMQDGWLVPSRWVLRTDTDESDWSDHVAERPGLPPYVAGRGRWDADDYLTLCSQVGWLEVLRRSLLADDDGDALTAEDVARIPGPNDVPLL